MRTDIDDESKILYESCLEAGYSCAETSFNNVFSCWVEERLFNFPYDSLQDLVRKYGAWLGFPTKDEVIDNFVDQSGEDLYGGSQADTIWMDEGVFLELSGRTHW